MPARGKRHPPAPAVGCAELYNLDMSRIPASQARAKWAETIDQAKRGPVTVTEYGRESVVILDSEMAREALDALERERATTSAKVDDERVAKTTRPAPRGVTTPTSGFVSGAKITDVLHDLGSDAAWAAELAADRAAVEIEDPWAES